MIDGHRRLFPDQNPFSTSEVKPGAIEFQFSGDVTASKLIAELQQNCWRGEIVGPHGSGKSTLLRTLFPLLESAGRELRHYVANSNDQPVDLSAAAQATWTESTQIVIEGYELLSRREQKQLKRAAGEQHVGLLITCHKPQDFPPLFNTRITGEFAVSLVEQLLREDCELITAADVRAAFCRHGQNLRELLFEMYDLYEQRRLRE